MGTFYVTIQVADPFREQYANIDALVDTGASYTSLPGNFLDELGIERDEIRQFELADNRIVEYPLGETRVRIERRERTVPVMFAPDDTVPLVGMTTLEILGLGIDPLSETLVSVNALGR